MDDLLKTIAPTGNAIIDSVIGGGAWNTSELRYGFKAQDIDNNGIDDFSEGDWKDFYGEIFDNVSSFADVDFVETDVASANLVQRLDVGGGGESGGPGVGVTTIETAVGIDPTSVEGGADIVRLGTFSEVWFHEIGHSLGLKHTHDIDAGAPLPGVVDPADKGTGNLNSQIYSVMGYTYDFWGEDNPFTPDDDPNTTLNAQPGSFGAIDIAALQHMYGARSHNTGNDVYRFRDDVDFNRGYTTIWDTGGTDTIAYEGASRTKIDLRAATLEAEIGGGGRLSTSETLTGGFTIAHGVAIENARGASGADILSGNDVGNGLDGGAGADILEGRGGNDIYIVDETGDRVVETAGGGKHDQVYAGASYTLTAGQDVEVLATISNASTRAMNLTGNEKNQILYGNAGSNTLDGGRGADTLYGLGGNDRYVVDNAADRVIEKAGGGSNDRVLARVSYELTSGQDVEMLATISNTSTRAMSLTGNEKVQTLYGNRGANVLDGKTGADTLYGLGGADTFVFSTTLKAGNVDRLADYSAANDSIRLSKSVFAKLAVGVLDEDAFKDLSEAALDADDRILYDRQSGALSYDTDGSGAAAAVRFATIGTKAALTHDDVLIA